MTVEEIRDALRAGRWGATDHAEEEAAAERLSMGDVEYTVLNGEVIEDYPDREPFPRSLVLGFTRDGAPVHSVWELHEADRWVIAVTVYRPTAAKWVEWRYRR